jgi:hypothetical protein
MCGIAGYVGGAPPELLAAMVRALKHRGPDDEGIHVEPGVGLGMTRLAIIDLVTGPACSLRRARSRRPGRRRLPYRLECLSTPTTCSSWPTG